MNGGSLIFGLTSKYDLNYDTLHSRLHFLPPLAALVGVYLLSLVAIAIVAYIQEWLGIGIFGAWIVAFFAFIIFMFLLMVGLGH